MRELLNIRLVQILVVALLLLGSGGALTAQPAPADWCLRWTDNCTTCSRADISATATCSALRPQCVAGPVRCIAVDARELRRTCERPVTRRESCNACGKGASGKMVCTLMLCAIREITCARPREQAL